MDQIAKFLLLVFKKKGQSNQRGRKGKYLFTISSTRERDGQYLNMLF